MGRLLSKEDRKSRYERAVKLWKMGCDTATIAARLGMAQSSVSVILRDRIGSIAKESFERKF
jgi:DNA-binding CsgD family transcriptional regulator